MTDPVPSERAAVEAERILACTCERLMKDGSHYANCPTEHIEEVALALDRFAEDARADEQAALEPVLSSAVITISIYDRVCGELEDGKEWQDIDNGLREPQCNTVTIDGWEAYMKARMVNMIRSIVLRCRPEEYKAAIRARSEPAVAGGEE